MWEQTEIRHALGVHLDPGGGVGAAPLTQARQIPPDQRFDSRVDIRAVERGDARIDEGLHVGERRLDVHGTMAARQLPSALQQS